MFTPEEATSAIRAYCASSGQPFPDLAAYFHLEGGANPLVRISSSANPATAKACVSFAGDELINPLLLFCKKRRIRLPANGIKDVTIHDNRLTLTITLRWWRRGRLK